MAPGRADLAVGLILLGALYALEWWIRRLPRTRLERAVGDVRRTGQVAKAGSIGLVRIALAEGELLDQVRRARG